MRQTLKNISNEKHFSTNNILSRNIRSLEIIS
jgi:hypothetical protein